METLHSLLAHPLVSRLGWSLAHFVWEGAVLAGVLAIVLVLLRKRSASARYLACLSALLLMAGTVPVTWCLLPSNMQAGSISVLPAEMTPAESSEAFPSVIDGTVRGPQMTIPGEIAHEPVPAVSSLSHGPEIGFGLSFVHLVNAWMPWIVLLWLAGVSILSARLAVGWLLIQRLRRSCVQPVDEYLHTTLQRLARRLAVSRAVRLVQSTIAEVPSTIGWLHPIILLPVGALTGLTTDQIEAIIAHELAHIRRYDYLINLLQSVVETLLFYHPAVWWVSRQMRIEREHCCDDLAVAACGNAVTYARALSSMESLRGAPRLAAAASGGSLVDRVRRVLGLKAPAGNQFARYAAGLLVTMAVVLFAVTVQVSSLSATAEQNPSTRPPATTGPAEEVLAAERPNEWQILVTSRGPMYQGRLVTWEQLESLMAATPKPWPKAMLVAVTYEVKFYQIEEHIERFSRRFGLRSVTHAGTSSRSSRMWEERAAPPASRPSESFTIKGTVLTPRGTAAAGAQVVVCEGSDSPSIYIAKGRLSNPLDEYFVTTDNNGRFVASPSTSSPNLMVLHKSGFGWVRGGSLSPSDEVRLVPWGTVKGTLRIGRRTASGENVSLSISLPDPADSKKNAVSLSLSTETEENGVYQLDCAPPFAGVLCHLVRTEDSGSCSSHGIAIDIRPGQVVTQQIGGQGRPIVGRIEVTEKLAEQMHDNGLPSGWIKPHLKVPYPPDLDRSDRAKADAWFEQWRQTDAGKKQFEAWQQNSRHYAVVVEIDGRFRAEDVPAGDYVLTVDLPGSGSQLYAGHASMVFDVPAIPGGRSDEPLDLGTIRTEPAETSVSQ